MKTYKNEDFFQVIGHISIFFATLDFLISLILVKLLKEERYSRKINETTTLGQKLKFLNELKKTDVKFQDIFEKLKEFLPEAIDISKERNKFIHDQWVFKPKLINSGKIERIHLEFKEGNIKIKKPGITMEIQELHFFLNKIGQMQIKMSEINKLLDSGQSSKREMSLKQKQRKAR